MFPDDLVERNRAFIAGRPAAPLPAVAPIPLAVVTCYDPRLDRLLRPALGLAEGEAFLFRTAGAVVEPASAVLRSLALAVYLFEVRRVLVLGHAACRMAAFPAPEFIESFRRRGVLRQAFGDTDIRTWAGAISSPRAGVLAAAATIAETPFLPRDLEIAGAVLDEASGRIELVLRPGETPVREVEAETAAPAVEEERPAAPPSRPVTPPVPPPLPSPPRPADPAVADHLRVLGRAVEKVAGKGGVADELATLRRDLAAERHPVRQLALVQSFLRQAAAETQAAKAALGHLHREAQRGGLAELPQLLAALAHPPRQDGRR